MEGMEFFLARHISQRNLDAVAFYGPDFDALGAIWLERTPAHPATAPA
jgi:hypothetical protein